MENKVQTIIETGGVWKYGEPSAPSQVLDSSKLKPKIILPNVPERVDVPVPTQTPWGSIALLNLFRNGNLVLVGSGFLCQPDVLVTAKHNLTHKQYDAAGVWMGFDTKRNPHVKSVGISAYAVHKNLDIAIFILASKQSGAFALGGHLPPAHAGVALAGYALPYPNGAVRFSYGIGPVTAADTNRLTYAISTREGDSGAPVFTVDNGVPYALAIHTEAATNPQLGNSGVHLSPPVVQDLSEMIAWARAQIGGL